MTTIMKISLQQAIDLAEAAVAKKGHDYVYERGEAKFDAITGVQQSACQYFRGGEPSCIVGQIIHSMGYSLAQDCKANQMAVNCLWAHNDFTSVGAEFAIECDEATRLFLQRLQGAQDNGLPWGRAVQIAKNALIDQGYLDAEPAPTITPAEAERIANPLISKVEMIMTPVPVVVPEKIDFVSIASSA